MSELQTLVEKLQDSEAMAIQLREAIAENPNDEILRSNAASIEKRRNDLARLLDRELNASQHELVRYRIMRDWSDTYPAKAVAASMAAFQELVTAVFDALRTRPKLEYRPAPENEELSTFNFAGASAGSVILSLAIPNDRLLMGETDLDRAFALVEQTLSARDSDDLKQLAETVGIASITKAYSWAKTTADYGLDTEIRWGKSVLALHEVKVSRDEAVSIRHLIENKSEESDVISDVPGVLVGFDGDPGSFHLKPMGDGQDIKGGLAPGFPTSWTTDLPYTATIKRTSRVKYATGEVIEKVTLLALAPLHSLNSE